MNIILACDSKYGIGKNNQLPNWNVKGDLKRFKILTTGDGNNVVIMGRKTYESLPFFPLKGRHNVVISRTLQSSFTCPNVASNLDEAYSLAKRLIGKKREKYGLLVELHYMTRSYNEIWLIVQLLQKFRVIMIVMFF